jgi:hypothetical protein
MGSRQNHVAANIGIISRQAGGKQASAQKKKPRQKARPFLSKFSLYLLEYGHLARHAGSLLDADHVAARKQ